MRSPRIQRLTRLGAVALAVAALASCDQDSSQPMTPGESSAGPPAVPLFLSGTGDFVGVQACSNTDAELTKFKLIKLGAGGTFSVEVALANGTPVASGTVTLDDGECALIWLDDSGTTFGDASLVTVTETSGICLSVDVVTIGGSQTPTAACPVASALASPFKGAVATFTNEFEEGIGRMTGGGNQVRIDGVKITRGLTIHCDILLSNNLEINWPGGNKWHITKPLTMATCIDDPEVDPVPPAAPFDTFIGEAEGELNGVGVSIVRFVFVDAGEPGRNDMATIMIWAPGDDPDTDTEVLSVSGNLDGGNLQAHFDQPHK